MKVTHFVLTALLFTTAFVSCQKEQMQSAPSVNTSSQANPVSGASSAVFNAVTGTYTLTLQPGPSEGNDLWMKHWVNHPSYADNNDPEVGLIKGLAYTLAGSLVRTRSVIKFNDLSAIPANANVVNASLFLYGPTPNSKDVSVHLPMGNTTYPGSTKGDNTCTLQAITSSWDVSTISWNNPPATTTNNQLIVGPSNKQWQWDVALNVTSMVQPMVSNPNKNNGFLLKLQTEKKPRALGFLSSNANETNRRPKLVVEYRLN